MTRHEEKLWNRIRTEWLQTRALTGMEKLAPLRDLREFVDIIIAEEFIEEMIEASLDELDDRFINKDPR